MDKVNQNATKIINALGGNENIISIYRCITRIRIEYKRIEDIDEDEISNITNIVGYENIQYKNQIQFLCAEDIEKKYGELIFVLNSSNSSYKKEKKGIKYFIQRFGDFIAPIFSPIIPALVVGGLILAIRNLLINYFGVSMDSGSAALMMALFEAGFTFLPVYLGYATCKQFNLPPVLGMMLGALLISNSYTSGIITDFAGISIPLVDYGASIMPVIFGVIFMYYVDKIFDRIIPQILKFFLKPLLVMIVVAPITLIVLGPIGNTLSTYIADGILFLYNTVGFIAIPILCAIYPYMVMLGLDKALAPIGVQLIATVGFNPITAVMGFVSNICIGATTLAVASKENNKEKKGLYNSLAITALCGVTEPAFYGALVSRPDALKGTAIGALISGLFASVFGLRAFVQGGCQGLLTFVFFIDDSGSLHYVFISIITAIIAIVVTFFITRILINNKKSK